MAFHEHAAPASGQRSPKPAPGDEGTTPSQRAAAERIAEELRAAAAADDLLAFARTAARIDGEITAIYDRHLARIRVLEVAFGSDGGSRPERRPRWMLAAADLLLDWLQDDPIEPTFLHLCATAAAEVGLDGEALALVEAALRLDPELADARANAEQLRQRRRARAPRTDVPVDVRRAAQLRRRRMREVARAAQPRTDQRISLCLIAKDEEEYLARCLEAAAPGIDEIVLVDTGSSDRTVEIAESFGARVVHHPWTGDFGGARNVGLDAATGDWLLVIDPDEIFAPGHAERMRVLAEQTWREAFTVDLVHHLGDADDGAQAGARSWRLFRNRPWMRYDGRIHEQIAQNLPGFIGKERLGYSDLRLDHYGYLGRVRADRGKSNRNLELLEQQFADGDDDAFLWFNYGSELMVLPGADARRRALDAFRASHERQEQPIRPTTRGYVPSLFLRYARMLRMHGLSDELAEVAEQAREVVPGFTDIELEVGLDAANRGDFGAARTSFERCLAMGEAPSHYSPTLGSGSHLAEQALAELDAREGDGARAAERLLGIRRSVPTFLGVIDPLAALLLERGADPQTVRDELTAQDDLSPSGWFMLGVNFQERGHHVAAEEAFRAAVARRPTLGHGWVALADCLLVQGRPDEALDAAREVPDDNPTGPQALRTQAFALLVLDDPRAADELRGLQQRLAGRALPEADRDVVAAWIAATLGEPLAALGRAHLAPLAVLLDGVLRLGAAEPFARLTAVLAAVDVPQREQQELLARTVLTRGLPELAADIWIEAVETHGPDADALAGLADAARLRSMPEDARTLADEALALEPGHALATRVLAALDV